MDSEKLTNKRQTRVGVGFAIGAAIAFVDNFAFNGEVSPIIIVALLLAGTFAVGAAWGLRGWVASAAAWACVPLTHLIKHALSLPDTLHPNTYASILLLAAFTLVVAAIGSACGMFARKLLTVDGKGRQKHV